MNNRAGYLIEEAITRIKELDKAVYMFKEELDIEQNVWREHIPENDAKWDKLFKEFPNLYTLTQNCERLASRIRAAEIKESDIGQREKCTFRRARKRRML